MRSFVLLVVLAILSSIVPVSTRAVRAQVTVGATLDVLAPSVEVSIGGAPFVPGSTGRTVGAGDQVRTGPTGVALLTFFDGSETQLTSNSLVEIEAPPGGGLISVFQAVGTSVSRVRPQSSNGGFQTDTPPATAFVRGTTYVVTVRVPPPPPNQVPPVPPPTQCQRADVTTCVSSTILLADPDGHVGRVGFIGQVAPTVELSNACEFGAAAATAQFGALDPNTCTQLQQSVLNLRDPTAAAVTRQIGEQVTNNAAGAVSQGGGGGGGGGTPPGGGGGGGGGAPPGGEGGDPAAGGPGEGAAPAAGGPGEGGMPAGEAGTGEAPLAMGELPLNPAAPRIVATNRSTTRFGIGEGHRNPAAFADSGATWQRLVIAWRAVQVSGPDDFANLGKTLPAAELKAEIDRGARISGLLQFTPAWAAAHPELGERSPPRNLDLPIDDPNNYWARFVYETVKYYSGQIDEWIIWNEPEFKVGDPGSGGSHTWLGTDEEFARLLKVGYLSAKRANPNAVVSFPGTSYWVDQNSNRPQFYERLLAILARDPEAARNHYYHDVLALNLYRTPDDILRVYNIFKGIQRSFALDVPIWLTETNAMPTDDRRLAPCDHAADFIQTTLEQQAAFAVQAMALASAAGYTRAGFYQMIDDNACNQPAVWGAVRDDGSRRPVFDALRTALRGFLGFGQARFAPLTRAEQRWPIWPEDPASYWPNWQVYRVVFDLPGARRLSVLWNGDAQPQCVRAAHAGGVAQLLDKRGAARPAADVSGGWRVDLPGATAHFQDDPVGYYFIGGDPLLLLEEGVSPEAPIGALTLGC
ncbi:MAG TPA: FecR domain-containing protein [Chloroflexota bacterium]